VVGRDMKRRDMPERYAQQFQTMLHRSDSSTAESKE
jgi:hypothetical protein